MLLIGGLTTLALVSTGTQPPTVPVPLVLGVKESGASAILKASGLQPEIVIVRHGQAGIVVTQTPAAGARVARRLDRPTRSRPPRMTQTRRIVR